MAKIVVDDDKIINKPEHVLWTPKYVYWGLLNSWVIHMKTLSNGISVAGGFEVSRT